MLDSARSRLESIAIPAAAIGLLLLCLATASLVPLFDPDEGYYPATASESLSSGAAWDPQFNNEPRWDKPILSYALIEGAFVLFGRSVPAARLPSALQGAALVLIVGLLVSRLANRRAGALAAAVLATTLGVQVFARAAHPEIALVLAVTTTELLICLRFTQSQKERVGALPLLAGVSLGYGILAKGPVAIALPSLMTGAAALVIPITPNRLRAVPKDLLVTGAIAMALAVPWYAAMTNRYGFNFLRQALWNQNVARYASTSYGHRATILFFVVPTAIALLPWTGFLPASFRGVFRRNSRPRQMLRTCMGLSAITAFVFYSLSASKLANYALVLVPPIAILIALYLDDRWASRVERDAREKLTSFLLLASGLALLIIPFLIGHEFAAREVLGGVPSADAEAAAKLWRAVLPAGVALLIASGLVWSGPFRLRLAALVATGALMPLLLLYGAGPLLREIYPWQEFGRAIRTKDGPVWMYGYRAPSLTFYVSRTVQRVDDLPSLERVFAEHISGWLIIEKRAWSSASQVVSTTTKHLRVAESGGRMILLRIDDVESSQATHEARRGGR